MSSLAAHFQDMTPEALAALGAPALVYIRPVEIDGREAFALCAANGNPLAVAETRAEAVAAALEHDMMPQSVH
ncbi:DUF1150 family protein [Zavarzinia sp. CC-PAN008]|uniref:DUF1150 family protein n=1 Tax=Zavarzinia sp. CC-PAN008 TaxID=3243332 RepID=UPI003F745F66